MSLTLILIVATTLISFLAFNNQKIKYDLIFHPPSILQRHQYYRMVSSGLIHADFNHLLFNMFTLYFFGTAWENFYVNSLEINEGFYLILYFVAMIVANIPSLLKHRSDNRYFSLGASGAVSAVVFSMILISPWSTLYVFFLPMPAIVFAVLYVGYSIYMDKKGGDNINHGAHLWGTAAGIIITLLLKPAIGGFFIESLMRPQFEI